MKAYKASLSVDGTFEGIVPDRGGGVGLATNDPVPQRNREKVRAAK